MTEAAARLTLKNLKVSPSLSEETTAYTATVCLDGKPVLLASNHGHGAADLFHRHPKATAADADTLWTVVREVGTAQPMPDWLTEHDPNGAAKFWTTRSNDSMLESIIAARIVDAEEERTVRRWCRTKTVLRAPDAAPGIYATIKHRYDPTDARLAAHLASKYPHHEVVNRRFL